MSAKNARRRSEPPSDRLEASDKVIGNCALCDEKSVVLLESHSIPKFVYDWIKATAKTPFIRSTIDVNVRRQDGPKEHLLCQDCETSLSKLEKELSEKLFKKIANYRSQASKVDVSENMRIAVLSIFWRSLYTARDRDNDRTTEDNIKLAEFLSNAKNQIKTGQCKCVIYITPFMGGPPYFELPEEANYSLERGVGGQDIRFIDKPHRYIAVFKIPFMYFHIFSDGWPESELDKSIELSVGELNLDEIRSIPEALRDYIMWGHEQFEMTKKEMSMQNMQKIMHDVAKNKNITGADKSLARSKPKKK